LLYTISVWVADPTELKTVSKIIESFEKCNTMDVSSLTLRSFRHENKDNVINSDKRTKGNDICFFRLNILFGKVGKDNNQNNYGDSSFLL